MIICLTRPSTLPRRKRGSPLSYKRVGNYTPPDRKSGGLKSSLRSYALRFRGKASEHRLPCQSSQFASASSKRPVLSSVLFVNLVTRFLLAQIGYKWRFLSRRSNCARASLSSPRNDKSSRTKSPVSCRLSLGRLASSPSHCSFATRSAQLDPAPCFVYLLSNSTPLPHMNSTATVLKAELRGNSVNLRDSQERLATDRKDIVTLNEQLSLYIKRHEKDKIEIAALTAQRIKSDQKLRAQQEITHALQEDCRVLTSQLDERQRQIREEEDLRARLTERLKEANDILHAEQIKVVALR